MTELHRNPNKKFCSKYQYAYEIIDQNKSMKLITHYYDDVKHDTLNCIALFPSLYLFFKIDAHLSTKSFRSRDKSFRSRCCSHS